MESARGWTTAASWSPRGSGLFEHPTGQGLAPTLCGDFVFLGIEPGTQKIVTLRVRADGTPVHALGYAFEPPGGQSIGTCAVDTDGSLVVPMTAGYRAALLRFGAYGSVGGACVAEELPVTAVDPGYAVTDVHPAAGSRSPTIADGAATLADSPILHDPICSGLACPELGCGAIVASPPNPCPGTDVTLTLETCGGTDPVSVTWYLDGDATADATGNPITTTFAAGSWNILAVATDACLASQRITCESALVLEVAYPSPVVMASGPTSFCASLGGSVTLDAGAGFASYQWSRDGADLPGETAATRRARGRPADAACRGRDRVGRNGRSG